jgi:hypothetical protein
MKTGQYFRMNNQQYLFLGYSDYKKVWGVAADIHGNKITFYCK